MIVKFLSGCPLLCIALFPGTEWKTQILCEVKIWVILLDTNPQRKEHSVPEKDKQETTKASMMPTWGGHGGLAVKGTELW